MLFALSKRITIRPSTVYLPSPCYTHNLYKNHLGMYIYRMVTIHIGTGKSSIIYKVEADTSNSKTLTFFGQFLI